MRLRWSITAESFTNGADEEDRRLWCKVIVVGQEGLWPLADDSVNPHAHKHTPSVLLYTGKRCGLIWPLCIFKRIKSRIYTGRGRRQCTRHIISCELRLEDLWKAFDDDVRSRRLQSCIGHVFFFLLQNLSISYRISSLLYWLISLYFLTAKNTFCSRSLVFSVQSYLYHFFFIFFTKSPHPDMNLGFLSGHFRKLTNTIETGELLITFSDDSIRVISLHLHRSHNVWRPLIICRMALCGQRSEFLVSAVCGGLSGGLTQKYERRR